jgi:hypothetical protein
MSTDTRTGAGYQDRSLVVCNDGVWRRRDNDCDGHGNGELDEPIFHVVFR